MRADESLLASLWEKHVLKESSQALGERCPVARLLKERRWMILTEKCLYLDKKILLQARDNGQEIISAQLLKWEQKETQPSRQIIAPTFRAPCVYCMFTHQLSADLQNILGKRTWLNIIIPILEVEKPMPRVVRWLTRGCTASKDRPATQTHIVLFL